MKDKAYEVAITPKYGWCQKRLASVVYKFFDTRIGSDQKQQAKGK